MYDMNKDIGKMADSLYAGGWRQSDKDDLQDEYKLTDDETEEICGELERIRCDQIEANWDDIVNHMNDEIREKVHAEIAPCEKYEFLDRYLELDGQFETLLKTEYDI